MADPLVESKIAEAANAAAASKEADHNAMIESFKKAILPVLQEALTYPGDDRPALVARIPVICNDIRWIKRAIIGIFTLFGSFLLATSIKYIFGL